MENNIIKALKENGKSGLTIAELSKKLELSRFIVRNILYQLEALDKIYFRKASAAKIYFLKNENKQLVLKRKVSINKTT